MISNSWQRFFECLASPSVNRALRRTVRRRRSSWVRLQVECLEIRMLLSGVLTSIGPAPITGEVFSGGNVSGRITGIAAHPTDANTIYIAAAGGGVWKTTDAGASWTALTDNQTTTAMGAIALAPSNPNVIYAGTGEANNSGDSLAGHGILISSDAGTTWTLTGSSQFNRMAIAKIAVDPTNASVAFAAASSAGAGTSGIYKTTDQGVNWTRLTALSSSTQWSDVAIDPTSSSTIFAAAGAFYGVSSNGLYKSTNGGTTWSAAGNFPAGSTDGRISLAIAPSDHNTLYASIADPSTGGLLLMTKSTDGGSNWSQLSGVPNYMGEQGWYDQTLVVSPTNASVVFAGGSYAYGGSSPNGLIESTNGGTTWSEIGTQGGNGIGTHPDHHAAAFDANGKLLDGDDGGIFRLDNPSTSAWAWSDLNTNLNITQFTGIALHPTDPTIAYGGSQDNGTEKYTGVLNWQMVQGGDGGFVRVDPNNPQTVYHTFYYDSGSQFLERSDDGGASWNGKSSGINGPDPRLPGEDDQARFYPPYIIDQANSSRLLLGTNRVYQTTNQANTWSPISTTNSGGWTTSAVIESLGAVGSTVYAAAGGRVFLTTNNGTSWTATTPAGSTAYSYEDIWVAPDDPQTAYTITGQYDPSGNHVFRTVNGGTTWTNITGNLPDLPGHAISFDTNSSTLYAGLDDGVYSSTDGGVNWSRLAGFPHVQVVGFDLNSTTHLLGIATHGRGTWELTLSPIGVTVTPTSGLVTTEAGGTATFTVVLGSQPTADVTIGLSSSNTAEGTVSPPSLTFTTGNWATPQTVTVAGANDTIVDGSKTYSIITAATVSTDPSYNNLSVRDVSVTNNDNDSLAISGRVFNDANGNSILDGGEVGLPGWRVYQDVNGDSTFGGSPVSVSSADVPKAIPDVSTATSTLAVSGTTGTVADINVTLNITHTYDSDLVVTLISPTGTQVVLMNQEGGSGDNFTGTILDDQAATPISTGSAPFSGTYRPDNPLAGFNGETANGTWTLQVDDVAGGDTGTINSWSLLIGTSTNEPSTLTAADGSYSFSNLVPGTPRIGEVLQSGFAQTAPAGGFFNYPVVNGTSSVIGQNFGDWVPSGPPTITTATLADWTQNQPGYNQTVATLGGTLPLTYSILTGTLPTGLSLNTATGAITGTPTVVGASTFTIKVTDFVSLTATHAYTITINNPVSITTSTPLPAGATGAAYSQTIVASGGTGALTFSLTTGALPSGLSLSSGTGIISGSPTLAGPFSFTVKAQDTTGAFATKAFTLNVISSVTITTAALGNWSVSIPGYSQAVATSGGTLPLAFSLSAGTLPTGLNLNPGTGVISGTPTVVGNSTFTVKVADFAGTFDTRSYTVTINPSVSIATASLGNWTVNAVGYSQTVVAVGGTSPLTFSISAGSLPTGLSLNSSTGTITGTPTVAGASTFTVKATDVPGAFDTHVYTITINSTFSITTTTLASWAVNRPGYNQTVATSAGTSPITFSISAGALPSGLSINASTGAITGTPATLSSSTFTVKAVDASGTSATQQLTITTTFPLAIVPSTLATWTQNQTGYNDTVLISGGSGSVNYSVTTGALPTGLALNPSTGAISGTPTGTVSATFTVTATDSAGSSDTHQYSLTINPPVIISTTTLPDGDFGVGYNQTLTASGGTGFLTFSVTAGALPSGLILNASTGAITGIPDTAGPASFTIRATDTTSAFASRQYSVTINPPPPLPSTNISIAAPTITFGADGSVTLTVSAASGVPTGTVALIVDGGTPQSKPLSNGSATFAVTKPSVGDHTLSASYAAQANLGKSSATGTLHVNGATTTIGLTAPTITFNANGNVTVTVGSVAGVPTGIITLTVDGGAPQANILVNGRATFVVPTPSAGDHPLVAAYAAQGTFAAGTANGSLHVNPIGTTVSLTAPAITYGANGSVTVTVASVAGVPTGNVSLVVDGGAAQSQSLDASGAVTFPLTKPGGGAHTLSASYAAQSNFAAGGAAGSLLVNKAPLTVIADNQVIIFGQPVPVSTVHFAGFVPSEGIADLSGSLSFAIKDGGSTAVTTPARAGIYTVVPSGLTSTNYAITFSDGTLLVRINDASTLATSSANSGANTKLFFIGSDTEVYAQTISATGTVIQPTTLSAVGAVNAIQAVNLPNGAPLLFVMGLDGQVGEQKFDPAGNPASGYFLTQAGQVKSLSATVTSAGNPLVAVIGMNDRVYAQQFDANGQSTGYALAKPEQVLAIVASGDSVFAEGLDRQVYETHLTGTTWSDYRLVAEGQVKSFGVTPAAGLFVIDMNDQLDREIFSPGDPNLGHYFLTSPAQIKTFDQPPSFVPASGNGLSTEVFVIGLDDQLYSQKFQSDGATDNGYAAASGGQLKSAFAWNLPGLPPVVFAIGLDSQILERQFDGSGNLLGGYIPTDSGGTL